MASPENLFEKNIAFFQTQLPDFYDMLMRLDCQRSQLHLAKDKSYTLTYTVSGNSYYIHSKYSPGKESRKLVDSINTDGDHIVLFGLGLGYMLTEILKSKKPKTRILVVEPEIEFIKQSLHCLDWSTLLSRTEDLHIHIGTDFNELAQRIHQFVKITTFDSLVFGELAAEVRLLKPFFDEAKRVIDAEIKTHLIDFKTVLAEDFMVPRNIINNYPLILEGRAGQSLEGMFQGVPGIIISAGPSLDKNILHLKQVRDRAIMIAVDTALKPLLNRSIQPHFTAIADPSYKNYLHLQGLKEKIDNYLVCETAVSTQVYRDFYQQICTFSIGKPLVGIIEDNSIPIGTINAWGSVISFAMNFAVFLGLNPIVFIGQDFAFSNMRNHCRMTSWEEMKTVYSPDISDLQRFERESISGNRKIETVTDIHGNPTFSSERLQLYKNYLVREIKRHNQVEFINASEGGILSEIPKMDLRDVFKSYLFGREEIDFSRVQAIDPIKTQFDSERLITFFNGKIKFFKNYRNKCETLLKDLDHAEYSSDTPLLALLKRAETVKNLLYSQPQNGDIMEMWSKSAIFHLMKKLDSIETRFNQMNREYLLENRHAYMEYFKAVIPVVIDIVDHFSSASRKLRKIKAD